MSYQLSKSRDTLSDLAVTTGGLYDVDLDYSIRSIQDVEYILAQIHNEYINSGEESGLNGIALNFAGYIIKVIETNYEAGIWLRDHEHFGEESFPYEWRGDVIFPHSWCIKRIYDGAGDDVWSKFTTLVADKKRTA